MKRIYKNIDIEFNISDFYALQHIKEGNFTFFTNSQAEGIRKTTADIIDNIIFIDGKDINLLKEGVLFVSYYCEEFDSRAWDNVLNKEGKFTTNYYIKNGNTIEAEPTETNKYYTKVEVDSQINTKQDKGDYPTRNEMNDAIDKAVTSGEVDLTNYYKKNETYSQTEVNNLLANYQPTVDLNGYAKKTDIPTKTSQLTNNSGFLTEHQSLVNYPTRNEMNDAIDSAITAGTEINLTNYYKKNETYSKNEIDNKNYLTAHQDISGKADKQDVYLKAETYSQQEVNNLLANYSPTGGTEVDLSGYAKVEELNTKLDISAYTEDKKSFALKSEIPTDYVSNTELNQKGYLTEIPLEYVTETELTQKGYLTKHQDISYKANKADVYTKAETYSQMQVNNLLDNYQPTMIIDSKLSTTSENVVQNKVVTKELNEKTETVILTQAEYNNLSQEQKNSNTLYVISDAPWEIDKKLDKVVYEADKPTFALKTEIPTKTSQLTNNSGFLTSHQSLLEYAKKSELPTKTSELVNDSNYLTSHQDISNKVNKEEISDMLTKTDADLAYQAKGNYLTSHQDISMKADKSEIPTLTSELTNDSGFLTTHQDITTKVDVTAYTEDKKSFALKSDLESKVDNTAISDMLTKTDAATIYQPIGDYALKSEIPNIDGKVDVTAYTEDKKSFALKSEIPNTSNLVTNEELTQKGYLTSQDISGKADKTEITDMLTKTEADLTYQAKGNYLTEHQSLTGYAKTVDIPTSTSELTNDSGFLTKHQDISGKVDVTAYTEDKKSFALKTEIPTDYVSNEALEAKGYVTEHQSLVGYAKTTEIPTKTSQLTNDSGFLTSHQSLADYALKSEIPSTADFVTNADLALKGYLTEHQDITGKLDISAYTEDKKSFALKSEIPSTSSFATKDELSSKAEQSAVDLKADKSYVDSMIGGVNEKIIEINGMI